MARFLRAFMASTHVERTHVAGHSFGGGVALQVVDPGGVGREVDLPSRLLTLPLVGELLSHRSHEDFRRFLSRSTTNTRMLTEENIDLLYEMSQLPGARNAFLKTARENGTFFRQKKQVYQPILCHLHEIERETLVV